MTITDDNRPKAALIFPAGLAIHRRASAVT
jgi:hypothetical protein